MQENPAPDPPQRTPNNVVPLLRDGAEAKGSATPVRAHGSAPLLMHHYARVRVAKPFAGTQFRRNNWEFSERRFQEENSFAEEFAS